MNTVRAKKALGQHFLNDEHIASEIADTISTAQMPADHQEWGNCPSSRSDPAWAY